jgi:hypothetical protein
VQEGLLSHATSFRDENIVDVTTYEDLKQAVKAGKWARGRWAGEWQILCRFQPGTALQAYWAGFKQMQELPWSDFQ